MILVLILMGLLTGFLSKPLWQFYSINKKQLDMNDLILKTHLSILRLEKLMQNCVHMSFNQNHFTCLLKSNLLKIDENQMKILNSALILENNTNLYSPKSDFKLELENRKNLYNDKERVIYALVDHRIEKIYIENSTIISSFKGKFIPIQARMELLIKGDKLKYKLYPYFNNKAKQVSTFVDNISLFDLKNDKLKICLKEQEQEYCLKKRLLL